VEASDPLPLAASHSRARTKAKAVALAVVMAGSLTGDAPRDEVWAGAAMGKINHVTIAISWGMYVVLLAVLTALLLRRQP
jgi:hypothetical protein